LINRRLKITTIDDHFDWIDVGRYGIAWPKGLPVSRLVGTLIELWVPSCSHFYFSAPSDMREGMHVVDVGASEGSFALECLKKGKAADVWCFEPDSTLSSALQITAERNRLADRVHIVSAAVTKATGRVHSQRNSADPSSYFRIEDLPVLEQKKLPYTLNAVPGISLDDWADQNAVQRLDFLKIDAEGSDFAVLQGARNCLKRWHPSIAVTTYHHPDHCNEMIEYLASLELNYRFKVRGVVAFNAVPRPVMLHAACSNLRST